MAAVLYALAVGVGVAIRRALLTASSRAQLPCVYGHMDPGISSERLTTNSGAGVVVGGDGVNSGTSPNRSVS